MTILLTLLLSLAHAKDSQLDPEVTYEPVAKTGRFKAEINCIKALKIDEKIPYSSFAGTHAGESGFYVLTNDSIHFYQIDKKIHAPCFTKATEPNLYLTKQQQEEKLRRLEGKKSIGEVLDEADGKFNDPNPENLEQTLNFLKRVSDNYHFKLQPSQGAPVYITHFTAKPEPDDDFYFLAASSAVSKSPPEHQPTCEIKEHEMVSDESKADLETELLDYINYVRDLFEEQVKRKMGDDFDNKRPLSRTDGKKGSRIGTQTKSYTLPNPQSYINRLNACKDVKSPAIIAAVENELSKFKTAPYEINNEPPLTGDEPDAPKIEQDKPKHNLIK